MSGIHVVRKGYVTKVAQPSVARQRGPVDYACSMLISGAGPDGATSPLNITDLTGGRTFTRALTPFPTNASPYASGGSSIYQTGTARQGYYANPVPITTGEFCIEGWFNPENFSTGRLLVSNRAWQTGYNKGWELTVDTSGRVGLYASQAVWNSLPTILLSTLTMVANTWNHVAVTRDSSNVIRIFINGVQNPATVTYSASLDQFVSGFGTHYFVLGNLFADGQFTTSPFNGYIGDVRIGVGTGSALYTANFTPPTSTLTATTGTVLAVKSDAFVRESSGNNVPVTPIGSVNQVASSPFGGSYPGSLSFTTSDNLVVASQPSINLTNQNFTFECWFNKTANPATATGLISWNTNSNSNSQAGLRLQLDNNGIISLLCSENGTSWQVNAGSTATYANSVWNHIAVVRNGQTVTAYLNGVSVVSGSLSSASASLYAGTVNYINNLLFSSGSWRMAGNITNVRLVLGTALYTSTFTPSTTPLTAISGTALLLLGNNVGIGDSSASSNSVSLFGTAKISTNQAKYGSSSLYFDGSTGYLSVANSASTQLTQSMFQVEMWIYPTQNYRWITGKTNSIGSSGWALYISVIANKLQLFVGSNNYDTNTSIPLNVWTHVAFTRDINNVMRVFIDGVLKLTLTDGTSFNQSDPLLIGVARNGSQAKFEGYIADYRIFNGAVKYLADFTPPALSLTTNDSCFTGFTNANYGVSGNFGAGASQGLVTKSAAPSISRYRGTVKAIAQSVVAGVGSVGTQTNKLDFVDGSSSPLSITRSGTPRRSSIVPYRDAGYWSVSFDGSGDYLTVPYNVSMLPQSGTDFTAECWIYLTGATNVLQLIMGMNSTTVADWGIRNENGSLMANIGSTSAVFGAAVANTWTHLAIVQSSNTLIGFMNGTQVFSTAIGSWTATSIPLTIGARSSGDRSVTGLISNARVVKGTAVYTASFTPPAAPLTAITNTTLLTCNSYSFWDQSVNNYQITASGNVTPAQDNPWLSTGNSASSVGSVTLDGASDYLNVANNAALDLTSGDWTIECWFWATAWKSGDTWMFIKDGQSGVTYEQYGIKTNSARKLVGGIGSGASAAGEQLVTGTTTVQLGCWYHAAFVKNGTTLSLYLNGKLEASATQTFTMTHGSYPLRVGGGNNTTVADFAGSITGVRVVKGTALYTAAFTPSMTPPTAVSGTSFLLNPDQYTKDLSGKNVQLRHAGNITQVPFSPFGAAYPGSYYCPAISGNATTQSITSPMYDRQLFNFGTQDFTIELWLYVVNTGSMYGDVIYVGNPSGGSTHMRIGDSGFGSKLQCASNDTSISTVYTTPFTRTLLANRWVHCALTRQSGTMRMFVDGVQQNIGTGINPSTYPLASWTDSSSLNRASVTFGGGIGGYLAFPHVVIGQALYTASFTKPTAPPTPVAGTVLYAPAQNYGIMDSSYQGVQQSLEVTNASTVVITNATAPSGQSTSFDFDGTRSVVIADNANNNFDFGSGAFTIEAFVRFASSGQMTIAGSAPGGIGADWWLSRSSTGALQIGRSALDLQTANLTWDSNTWYHVAVTKDSSASRTLRIYRDGVMLISSDAFYSADFSNQNGSIQLGAKRSGTTTSNEYMIGNIAGFRVLKGTAAYIFNSYGVPGFPGDAGLDVPSTVTNAVYGTYKTI